MTTPISCMAIKDEIEKLDDRVTTLEGMKRIKEDLRSKGIFSYRLVTVPDDYYNRSMAERAVCLEPCNVEQMCKSIVFENCAWDGDKTLPLVEQMKDITNSRYYLLVVQYNAKFSADRLRLAITQLRPDGERLARKRCNFQLASDGEELTGFRHNAVCPFGLMNAIPVVISEACLTVRPRYLYMGGGAVNTKLGLALDDFVDAFKPIIADVSEPR